MIIAVTGKGGVGKSFVALLLSYVAKDLLVHPLLIDADPTMSHLTRLLLNKSQAQINSEIKTIESIRKDIVREAALRVRKDQKRNSGVNIDLDTTPDEESNDVKSNDVKNDDSSSGFPASLSSIIRNSIVKEQYYDLLVMGQPELAGCFCPSNTLLKSVIEEVANDYPLVIIDCEAGLEQIHRDVLANITHVIVVADFSMRSLETADSIIKSAIRFIHEPHIRIVLNKFIADEAASYLKFISEIIEYYGISVVAEISYSKTLRKMEARGEDLGDFKNFSLLTMEFLKGYHQLMEFLKGNLD